MGLLKSRERAAAGRLSPSRSRWITVITAAGVLLLIGGSMIYRFSTGTKDAARAVSKQEYERTVQSLYEDVRTAFRATNVRPALLADRIAAAQNVLRGAASTLGDISPPKEVRDENLVLADAMRQYADDLERARRAAAEGDTRRVDTFSASVTSHRNSSIAKMAEAVEEMTRKGYDLGRIAQD